MDEITKTSVRNYLSAAGFFLIAGICAIVMVNQGSDFPLVSGELGRTIMCVVLGLSLFLISTFLIILKKRDMIAILFILVGFYMIFRGFSSSQIWDTLVLGYMAFVTIITLVGKDKKKWLLFLIPMIMFVYGIFDLQYGLNIVINIEYNLFLIALSLYFGVCCMSEKIQIPGRNLLTADESTEFASSGTVLCYSFIALSILSYLIYYMMGGNSVVFLEEITILKLLGCIMLIYVVFLQLLLGKRAYVSIFLLLFGIVMILSVFLSGYAIMGLGILLCILGVSTFMRKRPYTLLGVMVICLGIGSSFSQLGGGLLPSLPWVSIVSNGIPFLIALYLSLAVYSQKGVPKF